MFEDFRFSRNELCPCQSKKKYKECCFIKNNTLFKSKKEVFGRIGAIAKKSKMKMCVFKNCRNKSIIKAHALQENRILIKLEENKEVFMQNFNKNPQILELSKGIYEPFYFLELENIGKATTSTCFCSFHDNELFAPIEKTDIKFSPNNLEQLFLYSYKTFAFEYYNSLVDSRYNSNLVSLIPQLTKNPKFVFHYRQVHSKADNLAHLKNDYEYIIQNKAFSSVNTLIFEIPYRVKFASYMLIAPLYSIDGSKIKNKKDTRYLTCTIFPEEKNSYVLFSALEKDMFVYNDFFDKLKKSPRKVVEYYLNTFLPIYSKNLIVSPRLFNKWGEEGQRLIQIAQADEKLKQNLMVQHNMVLKVISKLSNDEKIKIINEKLKFDFFEKLE